MSKRFLSILSDDEIRGEALCSSQKRAKPKMQEEAQEEGYHRGVVDALKWVLGVGDAPSCEEKRLHGSQVYDKEAKELRWVSGSLVQRYQD